MCLSMSRIPDKKGFNLEIRFLGFLREMYLPTPDMPIKKTVSFIVVSMEEVLEISFTLRFSSCQLDICLV